jgi:hypothetical protein
MLTRGAGLNSGFTWTHRQIVLNEESDRQYKVFKQMTNFNQNIMCVGVSSANDGLKIQI